jgi:hypothetical protein
MLISSGAFSVSIELKFTTGIFELSNATTSTLDFHFFGKTTVGWSAALVAEVDTGKEQRVLEGEVKGTRQAAFQSLVEMLEEFAERFRARMV